MRDVDKSQYLSAVQATFLQMDSNRRLPGDEEFARELNVKDIYSFRNRNFLLRKLENYDRKEQVNIDDYTIEHIMPQNTDLSEEWQTDLGPEWRIVQGKYLHTIGNLTLTGYNPELSDRPFREKRDMTGGFKDSPIRLNRSLATLDLWNEEEIQRRAAQIAGLAVRIWPMPQLTSEILEQQALLDKKKAESPYTLENFIANIPAGTKDLLMTFRRRVLNLDSSVKEEFLKLYIAYKTTTNFVDVVPQQGELKLHLNMPFDEIDDSIGLARDVSQIGHWGNGEIEVTLRTLDQLEDVLYLVLQAFDYQREDTII